MHKVIENLIKRTLKAGDRIIKKAPFHGVNTQQIFGLFSALKIVEDHVNEVEFFEELNLL